jgi:hypothetical protein
MDLSTSVIFFPLEDLKITQSCNETLKDHAWHRTISKGGEGPTPTCAVSPLTLMCVFMVCWDRMNAWTSRNYFDRVVVSPWVFRGGKATSYPLNWLHFEWSRGLVVCRTMTHYNYSICVHKIHNWRFFLNGRSLKIYVCIYDIYFVKQFIHLWTLYIL